MRVVPGTTYLKGGCGKAVSRKYKFRSNSDLYLTGDLRQMLPGVIAYGVQFDLNLHPLGHSRLTPGWCVITVHRQDLAAREGDLQVPPVDLRTNPG